MLPLAKLPNAEAEVTSSRNNCTAKDATVNCPCPCTGRGPRRQSSQAMMQLLVVVGGRAPLATSLPLGRR
eukprot:12873544-Heterocapsa_arctica.AAC.1